ncbi:MAG: hypothetical protein CR978_01265 [Gammaproteobacteria bacterium]|nr:MAG: hypothetical protein CR978_01265 [Gammaproteobacteria bacterium]PIE38266.1 MAG: hypothetical protein CSA53_04405 [Gammaproteobacteria bacterium]
MSAAEKKRPSRGATRRKQRAKARPVVAWELWFNRGVIVLAVCAVLGAAHWGYSALREMPVRNILISGDVRHLDAEQVKALIQPELEGGFLGADLVAIRKQLLGLPWVYEASVRRQWPDVVLVAITGQTPIARWGSGAYLNHQGDVFLSDDHDEALNRLPLLHGPVGMQQVMMADYLRLQDALAALDLHVNELVMDERGELRAHVDKGFWMVLGRGLLRARLKRFARVYRTHLALGEPIKQIDLRYNNGLAVAFAKPPSAASEADSES